MKTLWVNARCGHLNVQESPYHEPNVEMNHPFNCRACGPHDDVTMSGDDKRIEWKGLAK